MYNLEKKLAKLKHLSQNGQVSEHEFYQLAHPLAEKRYQPLRKFLVNLLESPNEVLRLNAVHLLSTHWPEKQDIGKKLIELLTTDPNSDVRMLSASALSHIKYVKARGVLSQCANNPQEDAFVKDSCIDAIRILDGTSPLQILREQLNQIIDENWSKT
jgi:HEAT repeat protein